jgi:CRP-like cAMP-binding protein
MIRRRPVPAVLTTLRTVPELTGFDDRQLRSLLPYVDEVRVDAGRRLATAGQFCREFLIIVEGSVEACDGSGSRRLAHGDSCGWAPMWERAPNPATLTTTAETRLLVMGRAQFRAVTALAAGSRGARQSSSS